MEAFAAVACLISVIIGTHLPGGLLLGFPSSRQAGGSLLREKYQSPAIRKQLLYDQNNTMSEGKTKVRRVIL
jgi:hypothetical protein